MADENRYQHKRSDVAAKVPAVSDFLAGELLVNITDGKLYLLVGGVVKAFSNDALHQAARDLLVKRSGDNDLTGFAGVMYPITNGSAGMTVKPVLANGNYQTFGNAGAFTLQAPDGISGRAYDMSLFVWQNTGAGNMTATGFDITTGTFDPTAAYNVLTIRRRGSGWAELIIEPKTP